MLKKSRLKYVSHSVKLGLLLSCSFSSFANIDTIVVTASGFEQQLKNAPATISVLTKEELANKPYRDLTDALKDIPGVNITGGNDKSDITIRGMDAKYTLILVDGKKVNSREARPNSDGSGFEQGWLPPLSAIERIEVVRGPMSSLYGSDAMGGVINVITKRVSDVWQSNIRIESVFQDNSNASNYYNSSFSLMGPIITDVLGVKLYGQYSDRPEDKYLGGHAEQKLRSLNGVLSLNVIENQLFELDFGRSIQNSLETPGKTLSSTTTVSKRDNYRNSIGLTHKGTWEEFSTTTFVSHEDTKNSVRNMQIKNTEVNTQFLIPFESHTLTLGGKYGFQELHDKENKLTNSVSKLERWDYALFAENDWQLLDNLAITGGLRYNKDENFGDHWNPRIYSVWNINQNYTLKGGYSTGYTTPALRTVVADWGQATGGRNGNGVILGNPNLKPEKSDNFEIGLYYNNDDGLNASATAFYTKFKDKIQSYYICTTGNSCTVNGQTFSFIQSRENVDKADVKGIELSLKTPIFNQFVYTSNYAWSDSEQKSGANKGKPLNRTPKHKFNSQLDWLVSEQWNLWTKVAYYGKETTTTKSGDLITYPSYTFWDLGATYAVNSQTSIYAGVYNLFDKQVDDTDFGKNLDGRRYWVGLDINF